MRPVLLLLLLASLAGTVHNDDGDYLSEDEEGTLPDLPLLASGESEDEGLPMAESPDDMNVTMQTDLDLLNSTDIDTEEVEDEGLSFTIILVPVVLVVVIIGMIVCGIAMSRKWNQKMTTSDRTNDSYLQASSTEKVPMPMFDDDIPSVLELEMEEMDQWVENNA